MQHFLDDVSRDIETGLVLLAQGGPHGSGGIEDEDHGSSQATSLHLELARSGLTAEEIVLFYFPNTEIVQLSDPFGSAPISNR